MTSSTCRQITSWGGRTIPLGCSKRLRFEFVLVKYLLRKLTPQVAQVFDTECVGDFDSSPDVGFADVRSMTKLFFQKEHLLNADSLARQ